MTARLLALLGLAVSLAAGQAPQPQRPNVLLVTIDTLRADRLGVYGYEPARTPTLDALASSGVRFANATAHAPLTHPSHAALLTGRYQHRFGIRVNGANPLPDEAVTLAEQFKSAGYATGAVVASAVLERAYGLAQGFDHYDDGLTVDPTRPASLAELRRPASAVTEAASAWVASARGPWFAWVHYYDPHLPYEAPARFMAAAKDRPYDATIAYVDWALGELLKRVDRSRTIVLVTSDHGESLGEHGEDDHGYFIYDATLHVPLIVAGPAVAPRVVTDQVRGVDVAPTLASLAGLPPWSPTDGESLVPLMQGATRRDVPPSYAESWYPRMHFGWSELRSLRVGEWKYIAAPRPELYDLRVDPGEQRNVIQQRASVAGRLAAELQAIARAEQAPAPVREPDPEAVRRLQALGYVGSFAPVTASGATADPKDRVDQYREYRRMFNRALTALNEGRPAAAVPLFQQIVKSDVRAFEAHLYLGNAYAAMGRYDAALGEYEAARLLNPDLVSVEYEAAKVLSMEGKVDEALARARAALVREPHSFYGHYTTGVIEQKAGRFREAAATFARAVEINGREPRARANLAQVSMRLGDLAAARAQLREMIALNFQVAPAHYNLGVIALQEGDRAAASRAFKQALAADPDFAPARKALQGLQ